MIQSQEKKKGVVDEEDEGADAHEEEEEVENIGAKEDELLDMPPSWSPKLFINKDKFIDLCPNGEKTVFYLFCKIDFYSPCSQVDGLVKRITLYNDYKRLLTHEIRSFYSNRIDKLVLRRRFPYEFKLIEHYDSSVKSCYWKKLIQVDGRYRKIYFYHHRNKD